MIYRRDSWLCELKNIKLCFEDITNVLLHIFHLQDRILKYGVDGCGK